MCGEVELSIVKSLCIGDMDNVESFFEINQYKVLGLLCMHRCAAVAYYHLKNAGSVSIFKLR